MGFEFEVGDFDDGEASGDGDGAVPVFVVFGGDLYLVDAGGEGVIFDRTAVADAFAIDEDFSAFGGVDEGEVAQFGFGLLGVGGGCLGCGLGLEEGVDSALRVGVFGVKGEEVGVELDGVGDFLFGFGFAGLGEFGVDLFVDLGLVEGEAGGEVGEFGDFFGIDEADEGAGLAEFVDLDGGSDVIEGLFEAFLFEGGGVLGDLFDLGLVVDEAGGEFGELGDFFFVNEVELFAGLVKFFFVDGGFGVVEEEAQAVFFLFEG